MRGFLRGPTSGIAEYTDARFDRAVLANPQRRWTTADLLDRALFALEREPESDEKQPPSSELLTEQLEPELRTRS